MKKYLSLVMFLINCGSLFLASSQKIGTCKCEINSCSVDNGGIYPDYKSSTLCYVNDSMLVIKMGSAITDTMIVKQSNFYQQRGERLLPIFHSDSFFQKVTTYRYSIFNSNQYGDTRSIVKFECFEPDKRLYKEDTVYYRYKTFNKLLWCSYSENGDSLMNTVSYDDYSKAIVDEESIEYIYFWVGRGFLFQGMGSIGEFEKINLVGHKESKECSDYLKDKYLNWK